MNFEQKDQVDSHCFNCKWVNVCEHDTCIDFVNEVKNHFKDKQTIKLKNGERYIE